VFPDKRKTAALGRDDVSTAQKDPDDSLSFREPKADLRAPGVTRFRAKTPAWVKPIMDLPKTMGLIHNCFLISYFL